MSDEVVKLEDQSQPDVGPLAAAAIQQVFGEAAKRVLDIADEHAAISARLQDQARSLAEALVHEANQYASLMEASAKMAKQMQAAMAAECEKLKNFHAMVTEAAIERSDDTYNG